MPSTYAADEGDSFTHVYALISGPRTGSTAASGAAEGTGGEVTAALKLLTYGGDVRVGCRGTRPDACGGSGSAGDAGAAVYAMMRSNSCHPMRELQSISAVWKMVNSVESGRPAGGATAIRANASIRGDTVSADPSRSHAHAAPMPSC
jgi:hypothetical protein